MSSPDYDTAGAYALRALKGDSLVSDIDAGFKALRDDIDPLLAPWTHGVFSAMPTSSVGSPSGKPGRRYFADDIGQEFIDTGTGWIASGSMAGELRFVGFPVTAGSEPGGWLLCDGRSLLRTDYPALFHQISTAYGTVDSTHFTIPDMRGRSPLGAGTGTGLTARAVGAKGGEEAHLSTHAESGLVDHGHRLETYVPSTAHGTDKFVAGSDGFTGLGPVAQQTKPAATLTGFETSGNADAASAHNTMHPFLVAACLIKT